MKISVVVPVYYGELFLDELHERVKAAVTSITPDWELLLVNDQSPDNSWDVIRKLAEKDPAVKGIRLSRNFGQHYAITAGLSRAEGDWIVVMDCDLQDVPEEIVRLYQKAAEGYDSVFARRMDRQDSWSKRMSSKLFYKLFSFLTNTRMDASIANFGIYHRNVIRAILQLGDNIRYFPTMVQWVGFRQTTCSVRHDARSKGTSSYSLWKLLKLAGDNMIAFSDKPLRIFATLGLCISATSFLIALLYTVLFFTGHIKVLGFASLILSIWFVGGILMLTIGVVGIYVGKIFSQVKNRPSFLISEELNREVSPK